jgi:2-oxoglutarate ferredoxin oxidoreductase subunit beta
VARRIVDSEGEGSVNAPDPSVRLEAKDYKSDVKPIWCPGCGDFGVLAGLQRGLAALGRPPHEIAVVSGIGCSSRLPAYIAGYGFHGLHGRALPIATGIKVARPDLEVIAVGGDGDGYSIGGNHFLHACRRNVDMVYIVMDNRVYGMTKGQPSPTTEPDWESALAPRGPGTEPFNPMALALSAGANFIARAFSGDPNGFGRLVVEAVRWPGFSFIEVLSPCITFRPEQKLWKEAVHAGPGEAPTEMPAAMAALLADDGFGTGIFYRGNRPTGIGPRAVETTTTEIEQEFAR